jgi:hypothetical protein
VQETGWGYRKLNATFEEGQGPEGDVSLYMDGLKEERYIYIWLCMVSFYRESVILWEIITNDHMLSFR